MTDKGYPSMAVQECSGLVVRWHFPNAFGDEYIYWIRPPQAGITREHAEQAIEAAGVRVEGR